MITSSRTLCAAVAIAMAFASNAAAKTLTINLSGVNAVYDGLDLYDATSPFGGSQLPAQSDPLTSFDFLIDGSPVGTLSSQIYADFGFFLPPIPAAGGTVTASGGFFDLLTSNAGYGLGLDFTSFQVTYSGGGISATGTGTASSIFGQALPGGLVIGTPITLTLNLTTLTNVTTGGGFLTGFNGAGTATITGEAVPEPLSLFAAGNRTRLRRRTQPAPASAIASAPSGGQLQDDLAPGFGPQPPVSLTGESRSPQAPSKRRWKSETPPRASTLISQQPTSIWRN